MSDPGGLQQEAENASVDFAGRSGPPWRDTRDECFIAGYKAAAESRDRRIEELGGLVAGLLIMAGRPPTKEEL